MQRREFLKVAGAACLAGAMFRPFSTPAMAATGAGPYALPPLPYAENALEPVISARTVSFHYGKHTAGYFAKTAKFVQGTEFEGKSLAHIIAKTAGDKDWTSLFNNAAQAANHAFYWQCMKPGGGGRPSGKIAEGIKNSFGSFETFREGFTSKAKALFGSGWVWLAADSDNNLSLEASSNAGTPLAMNLKPVLTIDVWEHAYYLDYQNRRAEYVEGFMDKLVNWDFAAAQLG